MALVREALRPVWSRKGGSVPVAEQVLGGQWIVRCMGSLDWPDGIVGCSYYDTEAEALVAALEGAP